MAFLDPLLSMSPSDLLFQVILPFIFLFAVLFGVLKEIKWFDKRINMMIALSSSLMAFGATTNAGAPFLVIYIIPYFAYFAFGSFVVIFIVGVALYTKGRGEEIYHRTSSSSDKIEKLYNEKEKLLKKLADAQRSGDKVKVNTYLDMIKAKDQEIEMKKTLSRY